MTRPATGARRQHLIDSAARRTGHDPIFALDAEARARAAAGEPILNATLGALMDDEGRLVVLPAVTEALARVDPSRAAAYAPISGDDPFRRAVVRDVFGEGPLAERSVAVATAGGTGALHHAVANFLDLGEALLTTDYFWGPYSTIAEHARRRIETFRMFAAGGTFDLDAFEQALARTCERQERALVLFNFPCHNPTGYSLDEREWRGVAEILRKAGEEHPVSFVLDLAYARYGAPGSERWVEWIQPVVESCALLVAWSASKAFAQYGLRVGALIAVESDPEERERVESALAYSCRATWSNCNHLGLLAVDELLTDPALRERVAREREEARALLSRRVDSFNREAQRVGLSVPRYEGGFFVTVFTPDAEHTAAVAREAGVYVVPMRGAVRVAMCSTATDDVPRLVEVLGRAVRAAG